MDHGIAQGEGALLRDRTEDVKIVRGERPARPRARDRQHPQSFGPVAQRGDHDAQHPAVPGGGKRDERSVVAQVIQQQRPSGSKHLAQGTGLLGDALQADMAAHRDRIVSDLVEDVRRQLDERRAIATDGRGHEQPTGRIVQVKRPTAGLDDLSRAADDPTVELAGGGVGIQRLPKLVQEFEHPVLFRVVRFMLAVDARVRRFQRVEAPPSST